MKRTLNMLAADYGASSGRAMQGSFDGKTITLKEIHRFPNEPVRLGKALHWDFPRLFHELKESIRRFAVETGSSPASLAVDTWGVDFGLVDREGRLLGNPYHYRDNRTDGMMESFYKLVSADKLYERTGTQPMQINTVFQLHAMKQEKFSMLDIPHTLLFIPDLMNYYLTGVQAAEYTIASTSGIADPRTRALSPEILQALAMPNTRFADIVEPGTFLSSLAPELCSEFNIKPFPVIAGASHDTAAAVVAVPAQGSDYAYISSGTWSLMGMETDAPIINAHSEKLAFTNEGGTDGKTRVLKNIMGMWLIQECRRQWEWEGEKLSFEEMQQMAAALNSAPCFIDPDHASFLTPGNMPERIRSFARETGQSVPQTKAEIVRCIVESLALKYKVTMDQLESLSGRKLSALHIVGGGIQNRLLCQLTANATGKPVVAGPVEATAIGNLLVQAKAHGELKDLNEIRQVVQASFPPVVYEPQDADRWLSSLHEYKKICGITE